MRKVCSALGAVVVGLFICTSAMAGGAVFPHAVGSKWRYQVSNGTTMTTAVIASSAKSFTVHYAGAANLFLHWHRTTAGWTSPNYGATGAVAKLNEGFKMKTTGHGGVIIPANSRWKTGYRWSYWYTTRTSGSTGPVSFTQTGKMTVYCKIVGQKTISVPAGTYHCYKVRENISYVGATTVMGKTHRMRTHTTEAIYYARGVGMIETASHGITTKLVKYTP